jgi:predicted NBD/HSP70 family sugar kinase
MFRKANAVPQNTSNHILGINIDSQRILLVYGNLSGLISERLEFASPSSAPFPAFLSELSSHADRLLMITQAQRLPLPDVVSVSVAGKIAALAAGAAFQSACLRRNQSQCRHAG